MDVAICEPKLDYKIEAGDLVITRNKHGDTYHYLVVNENDEFVPKYRLLNLRSSNMIPNFSSTRGDDVYTYITKSLNIEILGVIPASKLRLGLK